MVGLLLGIVFFLAQRLIESGTLVFSSIRYCSPGCLRAPGRGRRCAARPGLASLNDP